MRPTFDQWLKTTRYRGYDRTVHDMLREAYRAGTKSDELDRAAELLREAMDAWPEDLPKIAKRIDAFLREISG